MENKELLSLLDSKTGKSLYELVGKEDRVEFTDSLIKLLKSSSANSLILNHNHPGEYNQSFSQADWQVLIDNKSINTLSLITENNDKYFVDKRNKSIGLLKKVNFLKSYDKILQKQIVAIGKHDELWNQIVHDTNIEVAKMLGIDYKKVK